MRDVVLVGDTARLPEASHTFYGGPADETAWRRLGSGELAAITLEYAMTAMPAGGEAEQRDLMEECRVVLVDSCSGRVGYVCSGAGLEDRFELGPEPPNGLYVLELEIENVDFGGPAP